jgi:SAM-dependent methyltransferase
MFKNDDESHQHSLETLNQLYNYSDFMESIKTIADIGCGSGKDLEWWATRTTNDEYSTPLNIECQGIDILDKLPVAMAYPNITYQKTDFEGTIYTAKDKFDVLWCHDAFQYAVNPLQTLINWRGITTDGAMLALALPQTTNYYRKELDFTLNNGCYYHHTIVSLIHMLAVAGWDCKAGFFKKSISDNWLHAIVYKSNQSPFDPKTTTWYDLVDAKLLPEWADRSILSRGILHQKDLVLPWLDKGLYRMASQ